VEHLVVALGVVAVVGCGDNTLPDPFLGLVRVSGQTPFAEGCGGTQQGQSFRGIEVEPSVAVDPTNPAHLVGAWQQDRWSNGGANGIATAASFDGGATWALGTPQFSLCSGGTAGNGGDYQRATDPWVTFAADGTVFQIALMFDATSARNAMAASRSTDGGLTWSDPTVLLADTDPDVFNDKESITADPTDPGRVYAVWDRLTGMLQPTQPIGTGPTWFARTTDGVWEPARAIYDPGIDAQTIGNVIAVLPDGTLIDVFDLITSASSRTPSNTLAVIRSADKGLTWSAPTLVTVMSGVGVRDPSNNDFIRSGTDLPAIAVDRATGVVYVVWEQAQPGTAIDGVAMVSSSDGGVTWSAPALVNGAPDVAAFTPIVTVASDGAVGVMYYDLRDANLADPSMFRAATWLAISRDRGATWHDEPLGASFDLRPAALVNTYFLGDYEGLTTSGAMFLPFFVGATLDAQDRTDVFVRAVR
jgi:Neuraminidase (sialidase)